MASLTKPCCQAEDEYMISDYDLFINKFISVPKDLGQLNCGAFVAGIVKGCLDGAGFPARYVLALSLLHIMHLPSKWSQQEVVA